MAQPSNPTPHVRLRNIERTNTSSEITVEALRGANLDVAYGEMVALVGPSGSGKTTLLNIMGCLDHPTMGFYQLRGIHVGGLRSDRVAELRRREIGFIFQTFNLLPGLTSLENVTLPLRYTPVRRPEARAMQALERVGLPHRAAHRPDSLTGEALPRVGVARALVNGARLLLADEPAGSLDSGSSHAVLSLLQDLSGRDGLTVVIATHDHDTKDFAGRILSIRDGRIVGSERESSRDDE